MRYGRYGLSYAVLRWGLGLTFAWIGIDMLRAPEAWIGYLPATVPLGLTREGALQLAALFDIGLGTLLLLRLVPRVTSAVAVLHLSGIIVMHGVDAVLIRDVGLLGAALALFLWPAHYRRQGKLRGMMRLPWPFKKRNKFED